MDTLKDMMEWINSGDVSKFYNSRRWRRLSRQIKADDKNECQICKHKYKRYRRADVAHHEKHIRRYPNLCMSKYYIDDNGVRKRNIVSVCKECHELECHPGRRAQEREKEIKVEKYFSEERWG